MNCLESNVLREYLDGELDLVNMLEVEAHLEECRECAQRLQEIADNDRFVTATLSRYRDETESSTLSAEVAWAGLQAKTIGKSRRLWRMNAKYRRWVAAMAAVVLLGSLSLTDVRVAVADFLSVFRMERVQTISVTPQEIAQIEDAIQKGVGNIDIESLGEIKVDGKHNVIYLDSPDQASEFADFPVKIPQLEGYGEPQARVERTPSLTLALKVDQVNAMIKRLNGDQLLPAELDGQPVVVRIDDAVVLDYLSPGGNRAFTLSQVKSPELLVPGNVDVTAVRDALLSLPFWPDSIRSQLAAIDDWRHTLMIPDTGQSQNVAVRGAQGIFCQSSESGPSTLLWNENGVVYCLQGAFDQNTALQIADSLR